MKLKLVIFMIKIKNASADIWKMPHKKHVGCGRIKLEESENHRGRSMPGPLHMLAEIPPKYSVSSFMGY